MNMDVAPPSYQIAPINEEDLVSEDEDMEERQSVSSNKSDHGDDHFLSGASLCDEEVEEGEEEEEVGPSSAQRTTPFFSLSWDHVASKAPQAPVMHQPKSPTPEEPPLVPFENSSIKEAVEFCAAGDDGPSGESNDMLKAATAISTSGENLDANRDIELSDIPDLRLRYLTQDVYRIVSKDKPDITIKACRDAITSGGLGWRIPDAVALLMGFSNDYTIDCFLSKSSVQRKRPAKSSSTSLPVASPHNHHENLDNDSDAPWEVFHQFLTIQRADFSSGTVFLFACEKLRQKLLHTWNLQFTQKFTHTLFINAMRSFHPFLANVLRRAQLAGHLEFKDLKRIIRMDEISEDAIIGHQTWGKWTAELFPTTSGAYEPEDSEI
ncbi:hypothetical protein F4801DRAFT_244288 [Xylaria longipes]|nr:hypothetical protein F4801DRAFT_244288 [Xylaria longipes]